MMDLAPCDYRSNPHQNTRGRLRYDCSHPKIVKSKQPPRGVKQVEVSPAECDECTFASPWDIPAMVACHIQKQSPQPTPAEYESRLLICDTCSSREGNYCTVAGSCRLGRKCRMAGFSCPLGKFGTIEQLRQGVKTPQDSGEAGGGDPAGKSESGKKPGATSMDLRQLEQRERQLIRERREHESRLQEITSELVLIEEKKGRAGMSGYGSGSMPVKKEGGMEKADAADISFSPAGSGSKPITKEGGMGELSRKLMQDRTDDYESRVDQPKKSDS